MSDILFTLLIITSLTAAVFVGYAKGHRDGYQDGFLRGRWTK